MAEVIKNVTPAAAETVEDQLNDGVPADQIDMSVVRRHLRHRRTEPSMIHAEVGPQKRREYTRLASEQGMALEQFAIQAMSRYAAQLSRKAARRA